MNPYLNRLLLLLTSCMQLRSDCTWPQDGLGDLGWEGTKRGSSYEDTVTWLSSMLGAGLLVWPFWGHSVLSVTPHPGSRSNPDKLIGSLGWAPWAPTSVCHWDLRRRGRQCSYILQGRDFSNECWQVAIEFFRICTWEYFVALTSENFVFI